jgi:hypothetical protein
MSDILRAPINYGVAAGGQFVKGGSVVFGFENIRPDAANPATLKAIFLDDGLTLQATNPQGLSSDATFDQADNGVLFGDTGAKYSIIIYDSNDVELSYIPSYDLSDASASVTAQDAANDASASDVAAALSEVAAGLSEANTLALYTDFVNRYFGAFASDPTLDDEGNPPVDGSIYWNTVNKTFKAYDSGVWYLPQDLGFGTAAYVNTGTDPAEIPLNSDLGTAAYANVQTSPTDATAGAVLNNETTSIGGFVNYTEANYQPDSQNGINAEMLCQNISGVSITDTVDGASLKPVTTDSSGNLNATVATMGGGTTWRKKYIAGPVANNLIALFIRIA